MSDNDGQMLITCPWCQSPFDIVHEVNVEVGRRSPKEKDIVICFTCVNTMIIEDEVSRKPLEAENAGLLLNPHVQRLLRHARAIKEKRFYH